MSSTKLTPDQRRAATLADLSVRGRRHRHAWERAVLRGGTVEFCAGCGEARTFDEGGALTGYTAPAWRLSIAEVSHG